MIVAILISAHLLADFLFQTSAYSEKKRKILKSLLLHCFIYFIVFEIIFFILFQCEKAFILGLIISVLHFLINYTVNKLEKYFPKRRLQLLFFSFNQLIHLVVIVGFFYFLNLENFTSQLYIDLKDCEYFKTFILYVPIKYFSAKSLFSICLKRAILLAVKTNPIIPN